MINLGEKFPVMEKKAVVSIEPGKEFKSIRTDENVRAKKWMVIFWYPKDFTFVCPTEIAEFNNNFESFNQKNAILIGASTDTEHVHLAWRTNHKDLKNLKFALLADTSKSLANALGILTDNDEKVAYRATFIVDPEGTISWVCVNNLDVGRNVQEILRVLDALQTGELTPCNWEPGQTTLSN